MGRGQHRGRATGPLAWSALALLVFCASVSGCFDGAPDFDGDGVPDVRDCAPEDPTVWPNAPDPVDAGGFESNCDGADGVDSDGDGAPANGPSPDCNDTDDAIHPGAEDLVDEQGVDSNCDGVDGEDRDGDGFPSAESGGSDCDDADPGRNPGEVDVPDDGQDQDCDGADRVCDGDGDGALAVDCGGQDCDDTNATRFDGAVEQCNGVDDDCDGLLPANEADGDGDGATACGGDCDDGDAQLAPGSPEACDGLDNDCSGAPGADEADQDGDASLACLDCDDGDAARFPGAPEACNGLDDDCDGSLPANEADGDGDGSWSCEDCDDGDASREALDGDGDGSSTCDGDCDDADPLVYPGASDFPLDGLVPDCDGFDGIDGDGDGFAGLPFGGSIPPMLAPLLDCDDTDPMLNLSDADADGNTSCGGDCDDSDPTAEALDSDADGVTTCGADGLPGTGDEDCDDSAPGVLPGAAEVCDGVDTDCDGALLPGDADLDGDGDPACTDCDDGDAALTSTDADADGQSSCSGDCDDGDPSLDDRDLDADGFSTCDGDCSDLNPVVRPFAAEICDGVDTNCDGALPATEVDDDGDAFVACADCDDADPLRWPGAPERCNALDDDCDGAGVEDETDDDGDGYVECSGWQGSTPGVVAGGDCDDGSDVVFPGQVEGCDNTDNDCNGVVDDGFDADGDGWCVGDCDDFDPGVWSGNWQDATESGRLDPQDTNCDGDGLALVEVATVQLNGPQWFGSQVLSGGDIDGDGLDEVVVAGHGIWFGSRLAHLAAPASQVLDATSFDIAIGAGASWGDAPLCFLDDLDGDGGDELVLEDEVAFSSDLLAGTGVAKTLDAAASAVQCAGDLDGDGLRDVVAWNHRAAYGQTEAAVFLAADIRDEPGWLDVPPAVTLGMDPSLGQFVFAAGLVGDVDGDGVEDLAASWRTPNVPFHMDLGLWSGAQLLTAGTSTPADAFAVVETTDSKWASDGVLRLGDLDGDGLAEVGAFGGDSSVRVYSGHELSTASLLGWADGVELGGGAFESAAGALLADFDGDGLEDLLVGPGARISEGAELRSRWASRSDWTQATWRWDSAIANNPGHSISAGDVDGDGDPDLLVGAPGVVNCSPCTGTVYVLHNPVWVP